MHTLSLDGPWRCAPDPFTRGRDLGYHDSCEDADWREVTLPSPVTDMGPEFSAWAGKIWYRREVAIPAEWKGQRITLEGDGLFDRALFWINGEEAGEADLPYLPWEIEVKAEAGATVLIAIEVDCSAALDRCPGKFVGWRPVAGILRPLRLRATAWTTLHLSALATDGSGALSADIELRRHGKEDSATQAVRWSVETREGKVLAKGDTGIADEKAKIECQAPGAEPWTPDSPTLYRLIVESINTDGDPIDRLECNIGFRRIAVEDGKLCLDGEPLSLAGANMHEDRPEAPFRFHEETLRDLERMRDAGANCVRLCHYPHDPRTLDACDAMGLFAMVEVPLYGGIPEDQGQYRRVAHAAEQLEAMIARDLHHPCIVFWAVSNEAGSHPSNTELVKRVQGLDPSRPATHVSHTFLHDPDFDADDVICINGYPSWLMKSRDLLVRDIMGEDLPVDGPAAWWRHALAFLVDKYPGKPIIITEWGHPAISDGAAGGCDEDAQLQALIEEPEGFDNPALCGTIVWCWADHLWPVGGCMGGLSTSIFGLLTRDRRPKKGFAEAEKVWRRRRGLPLRG